MPIKRAALRTQYVRKLKQPYDNSPEWLFNGARDGGGDAIAPSLSALMLYLAQDHVADQVDDLL